MQHTMTNIGGYNKRRHRRNTEWHVIVSSSYLERTGFKSSCLKSAMCNARIALSQTSS